MICNTVSDWLDCDSDCMGVWDWFAPCSSKPLVSYLRLDAGVQTGTRIPVARFLLYIVCWKHAVLINVIGLVDAEIV